MSKTITSDVLAVLSRAECEGNALRLIGQLERALYVRVNEVLDSLGGKWNRKAKAHLFDENAADTIESALLTGTYVRSKQDFGQFDTPENLADHVVQVACIESHHSILEPSAGTGSLIRSLYPRSGARISLVEIDAKRADRLRQDFPEAHFYQENFLSMDPEAGPLGKFDRILMNPPFSKRADIHHILHASKFLVPGGRLVSISSSSVLFREDCLGREFREFVHGSKGEIRPLPSGSFKDSGTMVQTALVTLFGSNVD